jgi:hypothetical protein
MLRGIGLFVLGVCLFGCSSKSKDSGQSPVDKCVGFADTWCNHALGCYVAVGRLPQSELQTQLDACKRVAVASVPCDRAVAVGLTYDQCINETKAMACSTWDVDTTQLGTIQPPTSCRGVIKVTQ